MATPPRPNPAFETARAMDASLSAKLAHYATALRARNAKIADVYQALVDRLIEAGAGAEAPAAGDVLPPFLLPDETGHLVASADVLEAGPLVVSFNRGSWCPFCWLELAALADIHGAVRQVGGTILSITPETAEFSGELKGRLDLPFPVLTDLDNGYALELGLAIRLSDEIRDSFQRTGLDLALRQNSDTWLVPIPATLVVDRSGVVRHAYVNADFRQRIDPATLPALLSEFAS